MKNRNRIFGVVILLMTISFALWLNWQNGTVMIKSRSSDQHYHNLIVVREVPNHMNPLYIFLHDSVRYRCEFHRGHRKNLLSCQTYSGDSFIASNARVDWRDSRKATVYLDDYPVLECKDGWWSKYNKEEIKPVT